MVVFRRGHIGTSSSHDGHYGSTTSAISLGYIAGRESSVIRQEAGGRTDGRARRGKGESAGERYYRCPFLSEFSATDNDLTKMSLI